VRAGRRPAVHCPQAASNSEMRSVILLILDVQQPSAALSVYPTTHLKFLTSLCYTVSDSVLEFDHISRILNLLSRTVLYACLIVRTCFRTRPLASLLRPRERWRSIVMSTSVCLCDCLSAKISPEPHARSLPIFMCVLPMAVTRSTSGTVMKSQGKGVVLGTFFPIDNCTT